MTSDNKPKRRKAPWIVGFLGTILIACGVAGLIYLHYSDDDHDRMRYVAIAVIGFGVFATIFGGLLLVCKKQKTSSDATIRPQMERVPSTVELGYPQPAEDSGNSTGDSNPGQSEISGSNINSSPALAQPYPPHMSAAIYLQDASTDNTDYPQSPPPPYTESIAASAPPLFMHGSS